LLSPRSNKFGKDPNPYSNSISDSHNIKPIVPYSQENYSGPVQQNQFKRNYDDYYDFYSPRVSSFPISINSPSYRSRTPIHLDNMRSPSRYLENYDKYDYAPPFSGENVRLISSRIISNSLDDPSSYDSNYIKTNNPETIPSIYTSQNQDYDSSLTNLPNKGRLISRQILNPNNIHNIPQYVPSKTYSPKRLGFDYNYNNNHYDMVIPQKIERSYPMKQDQRQIENVIEPSNYNGQQIDENNIPRATLANQDISPLNLSKQDKLMNTSNSLKPTGGAKALKNN